MEEIKTEPVDFVREFQEYLTQQTQHVNMISGSICEEKDPGMKSSQNISSPSLLSMAPRSEHNGVDAPSVEVSLPMEEGSDVQMDGLERTCDGKYKCSFCSYANKGMARLIEHIRIHTGEKPHRCQLCPFASAYERHLEAHMRSHTGEKPYKCDLCAFRCSDRSNLSHHRRRRHKQLPARVARPPFAGKRGLATLQKRSSSLGFGRRLLLNYTPPPPPPKSDYADDVPHKNHHHLNMNEQRNSPRLLQSDFNRGAFNSPLEQLASLQPADLHSGPPRVPPNVDEKPIVIQEVTGARPTLCSNGVQTLTPKTEDPASEYRSSASGLDLDAHDEALCAGSSRAGTPIAADAAECDKPQRCPHCDIHFPDNVLYTIHMGCHVYEHPFRCNVCGHTCTDKYDFACHFAQGQHRK
ncbi:zinc finger protein Pegasus-like isoform X1 [Syngnathus acus]|uniref:zinc finger protein Pegasus-like isoform X1 n=1 Tax=Syngnathus acus TaxID=161584 RepID=UPI001886371E|nr:zinc finger protein Pegasus-like isoform X1 [Syngnathus acus]